MNTIRYVIPHQVVRNEEQFMQKAIDSVAAQTIRPVEWIIVNDGSSDKTGDIINAAVAKYPWIHVIHRADRGFRKPGTGVMNNPSKATVRS